ncbi:SurA N-terminal domain-containing protein [Candidatus Pelagibacter sp.]|jgi:peptidyl-prolyl cis-trans isomerase D|nr:SurA N-terminal domain-containing protein [Candidatus Pelagibacter sp.]
MINLFKNFTKKKIGGLLLIIVIVIAFGFGGFGGGFNVGNQNNIAKINNTNVSTQDYMNYLNGSGLSQKVIKDNIDKNIIEELLSSLVSTILLDLEIKDLNIVMTENSLIERIRKNTNFYDEKGKFQRTLYEKFLLTNSMSAPMYEKKLKNNLMQKKLFTYISGGAKSPKFLVKKYYREKNRKLNISYISLDTFYKKTEVFTNVEIKKFVNENTDKLKQDYITFSYVDISPKNLIGLEEFNQTFFDKIDDIENQISKNIDFITIVKDLNLTATKVNSYINLDNAETIENKIYNSRNDKIEILEDDGKYIFYNIDNLNNKLPNLNDEKFTKQIRNLLFQKEKYEFNKNIMKEIDEKKFNTTSFNKLGKDKIEKIKLNSIKDNKKFEINSVKILYSLPINSFTLITDNQNIFIAKTIEYEDQEISTNSIEFKSISNEASAENRNGLLKTYDYLLNNKYKVIVNEKTLERVKNYFR